MTAKAMTKPAAETSVKVIVFGVDNECRPHAAWFGKGEAERVRTAAKQLHFNVIEVANGLAAEITTKIPAGRVHVPGPAMVPSIREDIYEKLVATINAKGEAGREPDEPIAKDSPKTWDELKAGHVVLIQDSLVEGWWAAVVTSRAGNKITCRWRDYPHWPKVTLPVTSVGLLSSPAVS